MQKLFITSVIALALGLMSVNSFSSADLTKVRIVKQGDTLKALSQEIYGNPGLAIAIAKINNIPNPNSLRVGREIIFPPVEEVKNGAGGNGHGQSGK